MIRKFFSSPIYNAVVLEYGGGGANAAPVMRAVLDAWFE